MVLKSIMIALQKTGWRDGFVKMDTLEVDVNDLMTQRSNEGWQSWPEEGKIGHLHLKTHNLESAYEFYVEKLGSNIYLISHKHYLCPLKSIIII